MSAIKCVISVPGTQMSTFLQAEHQIILRDRRLNLLPLISIWIALMFEKPNRDIIFLEV